jgi:hypothetical protein
VPALPLLAHRLVMVLCNQLHRLFSDYLAYIFKGLHNQADHKNSSSFTFLSLPSWRLQLIAPIRGRRIAQLAKT